MADVFTIDDLNALTTLTAADEVPVWDSEESGEPTKKITASNLAASVKSLASLPSTTEMNTAIQQSTAFANRVDCSVSMETFAETVPAGTFQYFRMRYAEPSSAWNYSSGFVFAPSSMEKIVVMFNREGDAIAMKAKYGNSWSNWKSVSLS